MLTIIYQFILNTIIYEAFEAYSFFFYVVLYTIKSLYNPRTLQNLRE